MSQLVNAEVTTFQAAREVTAGVQATTGYKETQVNPGGVSGMKSDTTRVIPAPLSKRRQREVGLNVDLKVAPSITHDLTKDLVDFWGDAAFLAAGKHTGNTGNSVFKPSAVTATGYTVPALGALTNNFLVVARNFANAANNGVKLLAGTSVNAEIKTTGLVVETVTYPRVALLEVAGWRGAANDIGLDVNGNLTSTAGAFTGWNLTPGQWIFIGGDTVGTSFGTAAYRGPAKVKAITATLLTLERRAWTVGAADSGSGGKTIDVYFGRFWRNVPSDHADSLTAETVQPNYTLEEQLPGAGAAGATSYLYGLGCMVTSLEINAPDRNKVEATISFVGRNMLPPTTTVATGSATSEPPIATARFNTADMLSLYLRVTNTDESALFTDIESWKLMINQNVSPQNQQGTFGAKRMIVGKCNADIDMTGFVVQDDVMKAVRDSRLAMFGAMFRNTDGAMFIDVPCVQLSDGSIDLPENGAAKITTKLEASREAAFYNTTVGLSTFPYTPAA